MAKKTIEQLAKEIYNEFLNDDPITMDEAIEMAKQEIGAKELKNYVQSAEKPKQTKKREVKVDQTKVKLIELLANALEQFTVLNVENVIIKNIQKEITFTIADNEYSISLIKHRTKKA